MLAPLRLISFAALALIWIQTATAWHETEHALHGHPVDELTCEILSGTAEQPTHIAALADVSGEVSASESCFRKVETLIAGSHHAYRSRAPPAS